ncbi:MAG TPA: hypothetical protein VHT00_14250 [Stellaceae bacterium]|jgi:hypothetical protein|nr:hypothetical protein [Stellaceae bacterium]
MKLVEFEPGRWRIDRPRPRPVRSELALPNIISDSMPPTEQVDGKFYTSKRQFRSVGRALGLVEIGTEKLTPKPRGVETRAEKDARRASIKGAIEKFKAGHRPR